MPLRGKTSLGVGFVALPQPGPYIKAFFNQGAGCGNRARSSPPRPSKTQPSQPLSKLQIDLSDFQRIHVLRVAAETKALPPAANSEDGEVDRQTGPAQYK